MESYSRIQLVDFPYYSKEIFVRCERSYSLLLAIDSWKFVHPMVKIIPVEWDYEIAFGLMYLKDASLLEIVISGQKDIM